MANIRTSMKIARGSVDALGKIPLKTKWNDLDLHLSTIFDSEKVNFATIFGASGTGFGHISSAPLF
jgi:hypothetical protein